MNADEISRAIDDTFAAYSAGDLDGFLASFADDLYYEDTASDEPMRSLAAFRSYSEMWFGASSDGHLSPVHKIISGQEAAAEMHFEGTHDRGPLFNVGPTGKRFAFNFSIHLRFEDGKVKQLRAFYSPLMVMQQLGLASDLPSGPR